MNVNHDKWNLSLFKVLIVAALFASTLSSTTSVEAQEIIEPNIENRLANVRERLKQIRQESNTLLSLENSIETTKNKIIKSQYWNDWSNWCDTSWCDAWNDWCDTSWCDSWNDWSNYY